MTLTKLAHDVIPLVVLIVFLLKKNPQNENYVNFNHIPIASFVHVIEVFKLGSVANRTCQHGLEIPLQKAQLVDGTNPLFVIM